MIKYKDFRYDGKEISPIVKMNFFIATKKDAYSDVHNGFKVLQYETLFGDVGIRLWYNEDEWFQIEDVDNPILPPKAEDYPSESVFVEVECENKFHGTFHRLAFYHYDKDEWMIKSYGDNLYHPHKKEDSEFKIIKYKLTEDDKS